MKQLRDHKNRYSGFVLGSSYDEYLDEMAKPYTWGDHLTLVACSDLFGTTIMVVTSFDDSHVIKIKPEKEVSDRYLWLSFYAEVHYNSIYPQSEDPPPKASSPPPHHQAPPAQGHRPPKADASKCHDSNAAGSSSDHKERPDSGLKYHASRMFKLFNLNKS